MPPGKCSRHAYLSPGLRSGGNTGWASGRLKWRGPKSTEMRSSSCQSRSSTTSAFDCPASLRDTAQANSHAVMRLPDIAQQKHPKNPSPKPQSMGSRNIGRQACGYVTLTVKCHAVQHLTAWQYMAKFLTVTSICLWRCRAI